MWRMMTKSAAYLSSQLKFRKSCFTSMAFLYPFLQSTKLSAWP
jgi:hypothetical protein